MDSQNLTALENRTPTSLYRVVLQSRDEHCELYAVRIAQGHLPAFLEIEQIVFPDRAPGHGANAAQERLRGALAAVKRCYIPLTHIVRIDEIAYAALTDMRGEGRADAVGAAGDDARSKIASLRAGTPRPK